MKGYSTVTIQYNSVVRHASQFKVRIQNSVAHAQYEVHNYTARRMRACIQYCTNGMIFLIIIIDIIDTHL